MTSTTHAQLALNYLTSGCTDQPACELCETPADDPFAGPFSVAAVGGGPVCERCTIANAPSRDHAESVLALARALNELDGALLYARTPGARRGVLAQLLNFALPALSETYGLAGTEDAAS